MATYFYDKDGSNGDGLTWANAKTTFAGALAAASGGSDVVVVNKAGVATGDAELAADTDFTTANSVSIISATKDDASTAYTPSAMGVDYWIGNSTTNRYVGLHGGADDRVYVYGVTLRTAGSTGDNIRLNATTVGCDATFDNCYFWSGNTASDARIRIGYGNSAQPFAKLNDCTFRFGHVLQAIEISGMVEFYGCSFASAGTAPTGGLFVTQGYFVSARLSGCDISAIGSSALIQNSGNTSPYVFERCKLGTSYTVLATQTSNPTRYSASALVLDCHSGDTHGIFGFYNALGSVISDTGIYYTGGAAAQSWKIVTSANCSFYMPFETPWINLYHTGTSGITPYLEILRDGSATAYQNDEIWAEFTAKTTSGSTKASAITSDRKSIDNGDAAADQSAGAGTGSWTGENATAWSGKIDSGSEITPAESGAICGRICVGEPSITVYVDPQIRT